MSFNQRLSPDFYACLHRAMRKEMTLEDIDLLILDSNDDVIYATGFSHYASERPVAFALSQTSAWLLVPKLEESHARAQNTQAELVTYFECPGETAPFGILAGATGKFSGTIGCSPGISVGRLDQIKAAFPVAKARTTPLVSRMRDIKHPEQLALHSEAARLSDHMVQSGVEKIIHAYQSGEKLPTEIEIEAHMLSGNNCAAPDEAATRYLHGEGLEDYHLHRVGRGMGVMFHEPPWIEAGDPTPLQTDMMCSNEPGIYMPCVGGSRLSDTVHITGGEPCSLTKYSRALEEVVLTKSTGLEAH